MSACTATTTLLLHPLNSTEDIRPPSAEAAACPHSSLLVDAAQLITRNCPCEGTAIQPHCTAAAQTGRDQGIYGRNLRQDSLTGIKACTTYSHESLQVPAMPQRPQSCWVAVEQRQQLGLKVRLHSLTEAAQPPPVAVADGVEGGSSRGSSTC